MSHNTERFWALANQQIARVDRQTEALLIQAAEQAAREELRTRHGGIYAASVDRLPARPVG